MLISKQPVIVDTYLSKLCTSDTHFPMLNASTEHGIYLNNAAQAPISSRVKAAGIDCIQNPQLCSVTNSQQRIRTLFAQIVDANASDIAIVPSTAFAISLAAYNLGRSVKSGKILLLQDQFCSAVYPWQKLCHDSDGKVTLKVVPFPTDNQTWTSNVMEAIGDNVKVACLPPLHWSDGSQLDLIAVSKACKDLGIILIVDATQAVGITPCSVQEIEPDMLVASTHKWLRAPSGTALAYINPRLHTTWEPLDQHGRGRQINNVPDWNSKQGTMDNNGYPEDFYADARKFDSGGKANEILLPMLQAASEEVVEINVKDAQDYLKNLMKPLLQYALANDFCLTPGPLSYHIVGLRLPLGSSSSSVLDIQKYLSENGVFVAARAGALRISPYLDNNPQDIETLIQLLDDYKNRIHRCTIINN